MDFTGLIKNVILPIARDLTESLRVNVEYYPWISTDDFGGPVYGEVQVKSAIVDYSQRLRRDPSGQEIQQRASLTFLHRFEAVGAEGRQEPIDSRDKFVLANGYTGPIRWINGISDPSYNGAPFVTEVILG